MHMAIHIASIQYNAFDILIIIQSVSSQSGSGACQFVCHVVIETRCICHIHMTLSLVVVTLQELPAVNHLYRCHLCAEPQSVSTVRCTVANS